MPWATNGIPSLLEMAQVIKRDGHKCVYCGATDIVIVAPAQVQKPGGSALDNLVAVCPPCQKRPGAGKYRQPED